MNKYPLIDCFSILMLNNFVNTQSGVLKNIQYPKDKQLLPKYILTIPVNICIKYVLK